MADSAPYLDPNHPCPTGLPVSAGREVKVKGRELHDSQGLAKGLRLENEICGGLEHEYF